MTYAQFELLLVQITFTMVLIFLFMVFFITISGYCVRCNKKWHDEWLLKYVWHFYTCTIWKKKENAT